MIVKEKPRNASEIAQKFGLPVSLVRRVVREAHKFFKGFPVRQDGHWQRRFEIEEQAGLAWHCVSVYGARSN